MATRTRSQAEPADPADSGETAPSLAKRKRLYVRKDDIVLEAAERVFLRSGFAATSMDDIASEANVSKRTVYSNFRSKAELFARVVQKRCESNVPTARQIELASSASPAEGLQALAVEFLEGIFDPAQVELYQTVVAAVRRHPDTGRILYDGPIMASQNMFKAFLDTQVAANKLTIENTEVAAAQLIALLKTNIHMKLLFGRPVRISKKAINASAAASVDLFLHGTLPRGHA